MVLTRFVHLPCAEALVLAELLPCVCQVKCEHMSQHAWCSGCPQPPQLRRLSIYWGTTVIDSAWSIMENIYNNQG